MQIAVYRKVIGAVCILAASGAFGLQLDRRIKWKCMLLQEMYELLVFFEKEMTFHRTPIQESFRCAAGKCTTELGGTLRAAANQIDRRDGRSFQKIWIEAVRTCIPATLLDGEECDAFMEAADALCNADTVMQQTLLRRHSDRFAALWRKEQAVYQEKSALYRKLSAAGGVFLVILLL